MIIVVTGNMGCGKSTVVDMLCRELWPIEVFDFDKMIRALYDDANIQQMLINQFGTPDRLTISNLVFNDQHKLNALVELFNPQTNCWLREAFAKERAILDIPLYFEHFAYQYADVEKTVICVSCPEDLQYQRIRKRNGHSDQKIASILALQLPQSTKESLSDYVVVNDGSIDGLRSRVSSIAREVEPE